MKIGKIFIEAMKIAALFGAVAVLVWNMPEHEPRRTQSVAKLGAGFNR